MGGTIPGAHMREADDGRPQESVSTQVLHAQLENANHRIRQQTETLRVQQERIDRLVASQKERGSVSRTAQHAFLVIGDDNTIRHAHPVFRTISEQLFGCIPKPGDPIHDVVRDQDRETFDANLAKARKGETVDIVQSFSFLSKAGEVTRWFRFVFAPVSKAPESSQAPEPSRAPEPEREGLALPDFVPLAPHEPDSSPLVLMHIEDITQRQLSEEALERSLNRHRSLVNGALDSVSSVIFIVDADERVVWVNQQAEAFFQFTRGSVLGEDRCHVIQHYLAPRVADSDAFERRLRQPSVDPSLPGNGSGFVCRVCPTESARGRVLEYRTIPIESGMYAGGRVEHFYDITRLKKTEGQLLDAKHSAERSREQTRRVLSTVSHEVRTAAAGMIGCAELLLEKDLDEESRHFAELIETSGRSILRLLSNVLDLARIETGMLSTEDHPFSPEKCGVRALDAVRSLAVQKSLDLRLHVTDAVPSTVLGDPVRLRQVLINLLSNAVKFTDDGRVTVHMDVERHESDEETDSDDLDLLVSVCDTGIGISAEEQGRLFEAFVQAGSDPDRQVGGSGLGLYIVGRLLDVMGGRLALDSAPDAGSRFHLRIPVRLPA